MSDEITPSLQMLIETILGAIEEDGYKIAATIGQGMEPSKELIKMDPVRGNAMAMVVISKVCAVMSASIYSGVLSYLSPKFGDKAEETSFPHILSQHIQIEMMVHFSKLIEETFSMMEKESWVDMTADELAKLKDEIGK